MIIHVALLRAINVGGRNTLPMKSLAAVIASLGGRNVRTYIQSGNAVFESAERNSRSIALRISAEIGKRHGFEPRTLVLSLDALRKAISANPYPDVQAHPASLHLGFLSSRAGFPDMNKLAELKNESERFHLGEGVFYLHAPEGVGKSRLAAGAEKALGVPMTSRNWKTVCKLLEMAEDLTKDDRVMRTPRKPAR